MTMNKMLIGLTGLTLALSACGTSPSAQSSSPAAPSAQTAVQTQALGGCLPINVALNKPVTASSIEMDWTVPGNAVDREDRNPTRWSSQFSDPQWLQVDLGRTQIVCSVTLKWEAAYGKSYQIQVSNDGKVWIPIYETTTGQGGTETITPTLAVPGRYVRMYGTQRGTGYGYSLFDFQVNPQGGDGVFNTYSGTTAGNATGWAFLPSEAGFAYPSGTLKGTLTSSDNAYALFLQRQQGIGWVTVARDTGFQSTLPAGLRMVSYSTPTTDISGVYRWLVSVSGATGNYTLVEQR